jgi:hypothetical protein
LARSRAYRKQDQQLPYPERFCRISPGRSAPEETLIRSKIFLAPVIELDIVYKRYNIYTMNGFEYDEVKSNTNSKKHGIDFIEAQKL